MSESWIESEMGKRFEWNKFYSPSFLGKIWQNRTRRASKVCNVNFDDTSRTHARWDGWSWDFFRIIISTLLLAMSRLALKISEKGQDSYSDAIGYIRTQNSFALLRSSVLCLRGSRSIRRQFEESSISAMVEEGRLSWLTSTILIWWFLRYIYSRCFLKLWYDALIYKSLLHLMFLVLVSFRGPFLTLYGGSAACSDLAPCLTFFFWLPMLQLGLILFRKDSFKMVQVRTVLIK